MCGHGGPVASRIVGVTEGAAVRVVDAQRTISIVIGVGHHAQRVRDGVELSGGGVGQVALGAIGIGFGAHPSEGIVGKAHRITVWVGDRAEPTVAVVTIGLKGGIGIEGAG